MVVKRYHPHEKEHISIIALLDFARKALNNVVNRLVFVSGILLNSKNTLKLS